MPSARNSGSSKGLVRSSIRTPPVARIRTAGAPAIPLLQVVAGHDVLRFALLDKRRAIEVGRAAMYPGSAEDYIGDAPDGLIQRRRVNGILVSLFRRLAWR